MSEKLSREMLLYLISKVDEITYDKLVALVFIAVKKEEIPFDYEFEHIGLTLTSRKFSKDLSWLITMGYVETEVREVDETYNLRTHVYRVSKLGKEAANEIRMKNSEFATKIDDFMRKYGAKNEEDLENEIMELVEV